MSKLQVFSSIVYCSWGGLTMSMEKPSQNIELNVSISLSRRVFFVLAPHLPNLSQKFLFWFILTFKNSPLPYGISKNYPLGRFGYFLEPWHIYNTELYRWYNVKQIIRIMVYVYIGWELTLLMTAHFTTYKIKYMCM